MIQKKLARNEADKLRRARKRTDQYRDRLIQLKANRINTPIEINAMEHSCSYMTEVREFCGAHI